MNSRHFLPIISLGILAVLPFNQATAEGDSFLAALLRFTGITATPSTVRGNGSFKEGDIWLVQIGETEASEPRKITRDGAYHTPLWIPGSQAILAMKGDKLIQLSAQGTGEKTLHTLADNTALLGFDKNNPNRVLVLQESLAGVLTLANGQITTLPYDKEKPTERDAFNQLGSGFRDYGTSEVSNPQELDPRGHLKQSIKIHSKQDGSTITIKCLSTCSQPALAEDGRQLLFIGR